MPSVGSDTYANDRTRQHRQGKHITGIPEGGLRSRGQRGQIVDLVPRIVKNITIAETRMVSLFPGSEQPVDADGTPYGMRSPGRFSRHPFIPVGWPARPRQK